MKVRPNGGTFDVRVHSGERARHDGFPSSSRWGSNLTRFDLLDYCCSDDTFNPPRLRGGAEGILVAGLSRAGSFVVPSLPQHFFTSKFRMSNVECRSEKVCTLLLSSGSIMAATPRKLQPQTTPSRHPSGNSDETLVRSWIDWIASANKRATETTCTLGGKGWGIGSTVSVISSFLI